MAFGCHIWLTFTILINQVCGLGYFRNRFDPWAVSRNEQPTVMDAVYVRCETLTAVPCQMFLSTDLLQLHFLPYQLWQPFTVRWLIHVPPGFTSKNATFCPRNSLLCFVWIRKINSDYFNTLLRASWPKYSFVTPRNAPFIRKIYPYIAATCFGVVCDIFRELYSKI